MEKEVHQKKESEKKGKQTTNMEKEEERANKRNDKMKE